MDGHVNSSLIHLEHIAHSCTGCAGLISLCHLLSGLRLNLTLFYDTIHTHTIYTNTDSEQAEAIWQVTGLHNWLKQDTVCVALVCICVWERKVCV